MRFNKAGPILSKRTPVHTWRKFTWPKQTKQWYSGRKATIQQKMPARVAKIFSEAPRIKIT